jgi:hypothetical protein
MNKHGSAAGAEHQSGALKHGADEHGDTEWDQL